MSLLLAAWGDVADMDVLHFHRNNQGIYTDSTQRLSKFNCIATTDEPAVDDFLLLKYNINRL